MDKYIKQLLEQYSKVILPKFGAIVIENEETGELMFNEYLNYNDGKLDELIEKESNMELQEAQNMTAKYIRDIQAQIDKGESYDIFGLGSFNKNKDGEVEFSGNIKTGESKNPIPSAGPSPTPVDIKDDKDKTENKEVAKEAPKKKEDSSSEKKENKYVAPVTPNKETSDKTNSNSDKKDDSAKKADDSKKADKAKKVAGEKAEKQKAKKKDEDDKAKAKAKAKKDKEEAKKARDIAKEDKKKAKVKDQKGKKKRKVGVLGWIIIVILFIAAGGTITAGVYYDEISDYMGWNEFAEKKEMAHNDMIEGADPNKSNESESTDILAEDEESADTLESQNNEDNQADNSKEPVTEEDQNTKVEEANETKTEETVEEPAPTPTYSTNTSSGAYHMIAGGFSVKSNAEDKVNELKGKGYDSKIIGRINGLHFVSVKSYSSLSAAKQDISNIRSQFPDAWIYKK